MAQITFTSRCEALREKAREFERECSDALDAAVLAGDLTSTVEVLRQALIDARQEVGDWDEFLR